MPVDLIILIAAIVIAWLVFTWLIKVIKTSVNTAISIAMIVLFLQLFFGIRPEDIWQQIIKLPETLRNIEGAK